MEGADGGDRRRPQVAELEDERDAPRFAEPPAGHGGEELGRGGDDDVGLGLTQPGGEAGRHEAQKVEGPEGHPFVPGDEGLDPDHADA